MPSTCFGHHCSGQQHLLNVSYDPVSCSQVVHCLKGIQATEQIVTAKVRSDVIEESINDSESTKEGLHAEERMPKQLLDGCTDKWADG